MGQVLRLENIPPLAKLSGTQVALASTHKGRVTAITIGGQQFALTTQLLLTTATTGVGGLDTGSLGSGQTWYVYAVVSGNVPALIASQNAPSIGPSGGFTASSVVGTFTSNAGLVDRAGDIDGTLGIDPTTGGIFAGKSGQVASHTFASSWSASATTHHIVKAQRQGGAVAAAIGYDDANTRMYFGTTTPHPLDFRVGNAFAGGIDATGAWSIGAAGGNLIHTINGPMVIRKIAGNALNLTTDADTESEVIISRTVNTPASWELYIPQGSTDLRFWTAGDQYIFSTGGLFTAKGLSINNSSLLGNIGASTYVPTITKTGGAATVTVANAGAVSYFRIMNQVFAAGKLSFQLSATGVFQFKINVPIATTQTSFPCTSERDTTNTFLNTFQASAANGGNGPWFSIDPTAANSTIGLMIFFSYQIT